MDSPDQIEPEISDDYYLALGKFIDKFAQTEKELLLLLRVLGQMPDHVARAVFSGVRAEAAMQYISRITTHAPIPLIHAVAQQVFTQLGHINAARNSIVHYGTELNSPDEYPTNRERALTADRIRETPVSTPILENMIFDLEKTTWHLRHMAAQFMAEMEWPPFPEPGPTFLRAGWRYTPPPHNKTKK